MPEQRKQRIEKTDLAVEGKLTGEIFKDYGRQITNCNRAGVRWHKPA